MLDKTDDKLASAKQQGQAQFDSIKEMVEAHNDAIQRAFTTGDETGATQGRIEESPLSVEVRSAWVPAGSRWDKASPAEYTILLCTGGPAVRIIGNLDEHCEPETARLEVQDWFTPWTAMRPVTEHIQGKPQYDSEPILLDYARCFWFGE